ncbi:MAG: hypothetical protein NCW75_14505 [Phycisphaera sp.]|nr:MAG: hypothetical protein NCW75_14505 [Phycisphaera sp.]
MRQKRWLAIGGVAMVLATGAALGLGNSSAADDPVRVYLVHEAEHPERGQSVTSTGGGITVFQTARGATWPTQVLGYLHDIEDDWVILRKAAEGNERMEIHIPRERVQLIEHISEENLRILLTAR